MSVDILALAKRYADKPRLSLAPASAETLARRAAERERTKTDVTDVVCKSNTVSRSNMDQFQKKGSVDPETRCDASFLNHKPVETLVDGKAVVVAEAQDAMAFHKHVKAARVRAELLAKRHDFQPMKGKGKPKPEPEALPRHNPEPREVAPKYVFSGRSKLFVKGYGAHAGKTLAPRGVGKFTGKPL